MTFTLHQGGVVMSSQITHTQSSTYTSKPIYLTSAPWFSVVAQFLQFIPTAPCNGIPSLSRWYKHQSTGGRSERTQGQAKNGSVKLILLHMYQGSPLFPIFRELTPAVAALQARPPSHHPSSLTSVSLVPALHLLPPSTPFWPYGTYPFFILAQTI